MLFELSVGVCGTTSSAPYSIPDISLGRCQHNLGTMASRHWVHLSVRLFGPTVYSVQISHGTTFLAKRWSTAGARAVLVRFAGSVENTFILRQLKQLDIVLDRHPCGYVVPPIPTLSSSRNGKHF